MHQHEIAHGIVENHPLLADLPAYLRRKKCAIKTREFLCKGMRFVYPKTLWLALNAEDAEEVAGRQALNDGQAAEALLDWVSGKRVFRRFVLDLRGVTIVDFGPILQFQKGLKNRLHETFFLGDSVVVGLLKNYGIPESEVYNDLTLLFDRLRRLDHLQVHDVRMTRLQSPNSLDECLLNQAKITDIAESDVLRLEFSDVSNPCFSAISMLAPAIHSIAHRNGSLVTLSGLENKTGSMLVEDYGAFRPVYAYLLDNLPQPKPGLRRVANIFPMHCFTGDELWDIGELVRSTQREMLTLRPEWLKAVTRLPEHPRASSLTIRADAFSNLLNLVKELIDNAAQHSQGLGYVMMALEPYSGLDIYVGDTGVGLVKGLRKKYRLDVRSDAAAMNYIMNLKTHREQRKRVGGFAFGGRGLDKVGSIVGEYNGSISLRSGSAGAEFRPKESRLPRVLAGRLYPVQGTHFHINIPTPREQP